MDVIKHGVKHKEREREPERQFACIDACVCHSPTNHTHKEKRNGTSTVICKKSTHFLCTIFLAVVFLFYVFFSSLSYTHLAASFLFARMHFFSLLDSYPLVPTQKTTKPHLFSFSLPKNITVLFLG